MIGAVYITFAIIPLVREGERCVDPKRIEPSWDGLSAGYSATANAGLPAVIGIDRPVLHKSIPQLTRDYAYIFIKGSAKIAENTTSAIRVADLVLIPVRHSGFDLRAVVSLVDAIMTRYALTGKPAAAFLISA